MLNGKYPLLLINIGYIVPIPLYLDENSFEIALKGEDKSIAFNTLKDGDLTTQFIAENTLQLTFGMSKNSQYAIILLSILDKLYGILSSLYNKYNNGSFSTSILGTISSFIRQSISTYSVSYYSDTDIITDAVITSLTKVTAPDSDLITVTLTLEKKPAESGKISVTGIASKIGEIIVGKGI